MKLRSLSIVLVAILATLPAWSQVEYFRQGRGEVLAYEYVPAKNSQKTLILLPGVNRALSSKEPSVQLLIEKGWGVLLPTLQAQPLSIAGLETNEEPAFVRNSDLRVQDFSADIEALVLWLNISNAVPVSLSYTSSVGVYLKADLFPHIIQTVPMVQAAESNPQAAQQAELWEGWFKLNPFLAPYWIRNFRDNAYSLHWGQIVDNNLANDLDFYGPEPRVSDIKEGYVTLARAAEDFDFKDWDFFGDTRTHDFVLAGQENPVRLANQIAVIRNYLAAGKSLRVVVATEATHIIPSSDPALYAGIIDLLASTASSRARGSVQFVQLKSAKQLKGLRWQGLAELEAWLHQQN